MPEPMEDGGPFCCVDHAGQEQWFEVGLGSTGASGDRPRQFPLAGGEGLEVLAVERRFGGHQGAEAVQPPVGQPFVAGGPIQAGDNLDQGVGKWLPGRSLGQICGQAGASQGGWPDDRCLLAREVVVERPGRHPDYSGNLGDPDLGQAFRLGQLESSERKVETGLLLLPVPPPHCRRP